MRIAAGVLLILVGLINLVAGGLYAAGGGVAAKAGSEVSSEIDKGEADGSFGGADSTEAKEAADEAKSAGGKFLMVGIFLIIVCGLQIAGAVLLFQSKKAKFIMVVAALGILAEIIGPAVLGSVIGAGFGDAFGISNIFGIICAIFAFIGARSINEEGVAPAAAA